MILATDVEKALIAARPVFSQLEQHYRKLPDTACHCDKVTAFTPETVSDDRLLNILKDVYLWL